MTATLTAVRNALKVRLETIPGLTVYAYPPGTVNVPAAVIAPPPGLFLSYRDSPTTSNMDLIITVFVQWGEDQSATEALDAYLADTGADSIFAAVEADQDLGGIVGGALVTGAQNHGTFTFGSGENSMTYFGVEFTVEVLL